MKRLIPLLLAAALLFGGCSIVRNPGAETSAFETSATSAATQSATVTTTAATTEATTEATTAEPTIKDIAEPIGTDGVLWRVPCAELDARPYSFCSVFGENLLIAEHDYAEAGGGELRLCVVNNHGEKLCETALQIEGYASPQVLGGIVAICDAETGSIRLLDSELRQTAEYAISPDYGFWAVGKGGASLYSFYGSNGVITEYSLADGTSGQLSLGIEVTGVSSSSDGFVCVTGLDPETRLSVCALFDLSTGELELAPFGGDFNELARSGGLWFANLYGKYDTYLLGSDDSPAALIAKDCNYKLLEGLGLLLCYPYDAASLTLYSTSGAFVSSCSIPGGYPSNAMLWAEKDGGLLFVLSDDAASSLVFWDLSAETSGEALTFTDISSPSGTALSPELYAIAKEIYDKFGVEVLIGDQCETAFTSFETTQILDEGLIRNALDTLTAALAAYPDGFLRQLKWGHVRGVEISLVGPLTAINGFGSGVSYTAFTQEIGGRYIMISDITTASNSTYYHEFSHITDACLAFDAEHRTGALFSEEKWLALCPEGFSYIGSYSENTDILPDKYQGWFADGYSTVNPTEDRARVMEYAMCGYSWAFGVGTGLRGKLDYYSRCIRDCFDTSGWSEQTLWEKALNN